MTDVSGKKILLGITGGIAAYKAAELTRLFIKAGADVRVVMTEAACRFITPATLQALSGQPVHTDMWDTRVPDSMGHIELSRDRDILVVAPATGDFLAKVASGLGDDLLSALCLARRCPQSAESRSSPRDRKSTRLNSSHITISYAVFCLKKKNQKTKVNDIK